MSMKPLINSAFDHFESLLVSNIYNSSSGLDLSCIPSRVNTLPLMDIPGWRFEVGSDGSILLLLPEEPVSA